MIYTDQVALLDLNRGFRRILRRNPIESTILVFLPTGGEGIIARSVSQSVHRRVGIPPGQRPPRQRPLLWTETASSGQRPPPLDREPPPPSRPPSQYWHLVAATAAVGIRSTGMHSC